MIEKIVIITAAEILDTNGIIIRTTTKRSDFCPSSFVSERIRVKESGELGDLGHEARLVPEILVQVRSKFVDVHHSKPVLLVGSVALNEARADLAHTIVEEEHLGIRGLQLECPILALMEHARDAHPLALDPGLPKHLSVHTTSDGGHCEEL